MKFSITCRKMIWAGLFFGICGLLYPNSSVAFSGPVFNPAQMEYVKINGTVMEVNIEKSYVVVAEKWFDVTQFKIGNEIYQTNLLNPNGKNIHLTSFKKGQRVIIFGIKLSKDQFVADSIQIKAAGNEGLKKYQLIPQARSIKPLPYTLDSRPPSAETGSRGQE